MVTRRKDARYGDAFYLDAINELDVDAWADLFAKLEGDAPTGMDADTWAAIQGAHQGIRRVCLALVLPALCPANGFYELEVNSDLSIFIPERLLDDDHQDAMAKALAPPLWQMRRNRRHQRRYVLRPRGTWRAALCGRGRALKWVTHCSLLRS